jgi:hypothetical protein
MTERDSSMLSARPVQLQAAVDALPQSKGNRTRARRPIAQLRAQLLERSIEQLSQQRMTHKAREVLPYLAVETRNPELRARIVALTIQQVGEMRWRLLAQMIPYLWQEDELRSAALARARQDPPQAGPRWIHEHWEASLGAESPPAALARIGLKEEPILGRLLGHLELRNGSPLGQAVLAAALDQATDAWLASQPYTETLRTIEHSTAGPAIRMRFLGMVLDRYISSATSWQLFSGGPNVELMKVARTILRGWPDERPGTWKDMPLRARQVGRWIHNREQLDSLFGIGQPDPMDLNDTWRRVLPWVDEMMVAPGRGLFAMRLGKFVFLEQTGRPQLCLIYPVRGWWRAWRDILSAHPPPLPEPLQVFSREERWRTRFDLFLVENCGLPPDLDTLPLVETDRKEASRATP